MQALTGIVHIARTTPKTTLATPTCPTTSACRAPGCTHTRFIEIHHIEDWASGGLTDLENLLPLCSACHSLVTEGYLQTLKEHSDIHFVYRDGTRFVSTNYSLPRRDDIRRTMEECNWSFSD